MKEGKYVLRWMALLIAIPVGFAGAMVTLAFRHTLDFFNRLLFGRSDDITLAMHAWPWYCWPLIVGGGGVIAGIFLQYAVRLEKKQRINTDYLDVINARLDAVPTRTSLFRALSSIASISSGASIGKEGPMVQLAALCGSIMGRFLPAATLLKNCDVVAMAAAAGLASVYHAPLASAIFVAEVAFGISALQRLIPLVISAAVSVMTLWWLGYRSALYPLADVQFSVSVASVVTVVAIGCIGGLAGAGFITLAGYSKKQFSRITSLPCRLASGGIAVGLLAVLSTDILGNGYDVIVNIFRGHYLFDGLLLVLVLKLLATCCSVGSSAVGGMFTPSLLIGALLGAMFTLLTEHLGLGGQPGWLYAAVGMGAVLAAISQAPLMAMLMVLEMTLNSSLLFPLMIATVLATMVTYRLQSAVTYPLITTHFSRAEAKFDFDNTAIAELIIPGAAILPGTPVSDALAISTLKRERYVYVINESGRFLGVVSIHEIAASVLSQKITSDSPVSAVMDNEFPYVCQGQSLREGWEAFEKVTLERLPVLSSDTERYFLGALTKTSLIRKAGAFI